MIFIHLKIKHAIESCFERFFVFEYSFGKPKGLLNIMPPSSTIVKVYFYCIIHFKLLVKNKVGRVGFEPTIMKTFEIFWSTNCHTVP